MTMIGKVRRELKELGFRPHLGQEIQSLGVELTVCQLIVVLLSIISIVFLFVPMFYLQDTRFLLLFFSLSLLCIGTGVWFWMHQEDICEHPEDYQE